MSSIVFHIENCAVLGLQPTAVIVPIIDPVHNPEVITLNYAAGKQSKENRKANRRICTNVTCQP